MGDNLSSLTVIFTEFYYWVTVVFMFLIHVGFCMYEVGASRRKNHLHTLLKEHDGDPAGDRHLLLLRMVALFCFHQWPGHCRGWPCFGAICRAMEPVDGGASFGRRPGFGRPSRRT